MEENHAIEQTFIWSKDIILKNLIWEIKNDIVCVRDLDINDKYARHIVFEVIIDNFVELAKSMDLYKGSKGTDINLTFTYICEGKDYVYFLIGKLNHKTENEDIHIFYNDGIQFNIMKCKYICSGNYLDITFKELFDACHNKVALGYRK